MALRLISLIVAALLIVGGLLVPARRGSPAPAPAGAGPGGRSLDRLWVALPVAFLAALLVVVAVRL